MSDTPRSTPRLGAQGDRRPTDLAGRAHLDTGGWSSRRKTEIVLRLLKGETLDALSRELGVSSGRLAERRDEAFAAMQVGLQSREPDHRDDFIHQTLASGFAPRSASRPCSSSSSNARSTSWRPAFALPSGGRRDEPIGESLRQRGLRPRQSLPRLEDPASHRLQAPHCEHCSGACTCQARPQERPLRPARGRTLIRSPAAPEPRRSFRSSTD